MLTWLLFFGLAKTAIGAEVLTYVFLPYVCQPALESLIVCYTAWMAEMFVSFGLEV